MCATIYLPEIFLHFLFIFSAKMLLASCRGELAKMVTRLYLSYMACGREMKPVVWPAYLQQQLTL